MPSQDKAKALYAKTWNSIILCLENKKDSDIQIYLESFRDKAYRNLLEARNVEQSKATLDCTNIYLRTGELPKPV